MRTVSVALYQYEELSESAKDAARDWYRSIPDDFFTEYVFEDFCTIAGFMGFEIDTHEVTLMSGKKRQDPSIWYSGFCSQGDGACFEGRWAAADVKADKLREHAPIDTKLHSIVAEFEDLAAKHPDVSFRIKHTDRYCHAYTTSFDFDAPSVDEKLNELEYQSPEFKAVQAAWDSVEKNLTEASRDLMNWLYRQLEAEYNYQNSDEAVAESIEANGYEFHEDGSRA